MATFETQVITDPRQFGELRTEWNQLLQRSTTNTIFLTWEWLYTWWKVFGDGTELFIILVRDVEGALIGAAPLLIRRSNYYKFPVREMIFIGMGQADRQDFIVADDDYQIVHDILSKIHENISQWDIVNLEQIPSDSFLAKSEFIRAFRMEKEFSSLCPYVRMEGGWEEYFKSLSKKFRRDIKHKTNRIARFGRWAFETERSPDDVETLVESMELIERTSRKSSTQKAFFAPIGARDFILKFCKLCQQNDWLDFSRITLNDKPIAYLLGFLYGNKYCAYNMAFSEDFHEASPGKLLLNEKIKWCFEHIDIAEEFDFLRGDTYIKALWTSDNRVHLRIVLFKNSLYSKVIRFAVFHIRPAIKRILKRDRKSL